MALKKTRFKPPVYVNGKATYPDTHHFETSGDQVKITDTGEYFESDNVEGALQETADLVSTNVGDLETLTTTDKSSLVNATNEVKNLVDTNMTDLVAHKEDYATSKQEIIDARGSYTTLGSRIDKFEELANFKLKNMITNGNFSDGVAGYTNKIGSMTAIDYEAEIAVENLATTASYFSQQNNIYKDRVYFARFDIKPKYSNITRFRIGGVQTEEVNPIPNEYNKISAVVKSNLDSSSITEMRFIHYTDTNYLVGDIIYIRNVMLIDLTSIFGFGNEPTKKEFENLLEMFDDQWFDGTQLIGSKFSKSLYELTTMFTSDGEEWEVI